MIYTTGVKSLETLEFEVPKLLTPVVYTPNHTGQVLTGTIWDFAPSLL